MVAANNKRQYARCPHCGRQPVPLKRGRIASHLNPGGVKCIAIGLDYTQWVRLQESIAAAKRK